MKKQFYSNGKLLITGEYIVLDGALALGLPTKFGQYLEICEAESNAIKWQSFDSDGACWFETNITFASVKTKTTVENDLVHLKLIEILHHAHLLNNEILDNAKGFEVRTKLTFPRKWGLGTSSTLINNIAQWFEIDAFALLHNSFGGSGYDIACAQSNQPILFQLCDQKPLINTVFFSPKFSNNLYFLYLNQKQDSNTSIKMYRQKKFDINNAILQIDDITNQITSENLLFDEFCALLKLHENLMSQILETPTIKNKLFSNFDGTIKSLGAWGGDFVLVASASNPKKYFQEKGFTTILKYHEIIL